MNEEDVRAWNAAHRQLDEVASGASAFVDNLFVPSLTGRIPADEIKAAVLNWVRSFDKYHARRLPDEQATAIAIGLFVAAMEVKRGYTLRDVATGEADTGDGPKWMADVFSTSKPNREALKDVLVEKLLRRKEMAQLIPKILSRQNDHTREAWKTLTAPTAHDPTNFSYLVHGMRMRSVVVTANNEEERAYLLKTLGDAATPDPTDRMKFNFNPGLHLLRNPLNVQSEMLSTSLITQDHVATYQGMSFGFIIDAPAENVALSHQTDAMVASIQPVARGHKLQGKSKFEQNIELNEFYTQLHGMFLQEVYTPAALLLGADAAAHNEVLVVGTLGHKQIRPSGLFVKVGPNGQLLASVVADIEQHNLQQEMLKTAQLLRIPIVPIVDPRGVESSRPFNAYEWNPNHSWVKGTAPLGPADGLRLPPLIGPIVGETIATAPMLPTSTTTRTSSSTSSASWTHAHMPLAIEISSKTNVGRLGSSGRIGALRRSSGSGRR